MNSQIYYILHACERKHIGVTYKPSCVNIAVTALELQSGD
jgi:hypothetical protein